MSPSITYVQPTSRPPFWPFIIIALLLLALIYVLRAYQAKSGEAQSTANYSALLQHRINQQGDSIVQQGQRLVFSQAELNKRIQPVEGVKSVQTQVHTVGRVEIRNVYVPIDKPVYYRDSTGSYLKTPAAFAVHNKWYALNGTITDSARVLLHNLTVVDEPTITLGYADRGWKGWFSKDVPIVTYTNKNPYISISSMENFVLAPSPAKRFGIGLQVGYGFSNAFLPSPYIGIGLQYSLIRF